MSGTTLSPAPSPGGSTAPGCAYTVFLRRHTALPAMADLDREQTRREIDALDRKAQDIYGATNRTHLLAFCQAVVKACADQRALLRELDKAERERDEAQQESDEALRSEAAAIDRANAAEAQLRELKSILRAWALGDADRMNAGMLGAFLRVFGKATPTLPACRGPKRT